MNQTTEKRYADAIDKIDELNCDTSCSPKETLYALISLKEHLCMLIDALQATTEEDEA